MRRISTSSVQRRGQQTSLRLCVREFSHPSRATHTAHYAAVVSQAQHHSQQSPPSSRLVVTVTPDSSSSSAAAGAPKRSHSSVRLDISDKNDHNCRRSPSLLSLPLVPSYAAARGYGPFTRTYVLLAPRSGTAGSVGGIGVGTSGVRGNSGATKNTIEVGLSDDIEMDIRSAEEQGKGGVDEKSSSRSSETTSNAARAKGVAGGAASSKSFGDTRVADEEVVIFDGDDDEEVGSSTSAAGGKRVDRTAASSNRASRGVSDSAPTAVAFQRLSELVEMADLEEEDEVGGGGTNGDDGYENTERLGQASPSSVAPQPPPEQRRQHVLTKPRYISTPTATVSTVSREGGGSGASAVGKSTAAPKSELDMKQDVDGDVVVDVDGGGGLVKEEDGENNTNNTNNKDDEEGYDTNGLSKKAFANLEEMAQFESIDDGISLGSVEFEAAVADTTNSTINNNTKNVTSGSDATATATESRRVAAARGARGPKDDDEDAAAAVSSFTKMTNLEELVKRAEEEEALLDDNDASFSGALLNKKKKSKTTTNTANAALSAKKAHNDDDPSALIDDLFDDMLSILPAAVTVIEASGSGAAASSATSSSSSSPQSSLSNVRGISPSRGEQFTNRPKPTRSPFAESSSGSGDENSAFASVDAKKKSSRFSSSPSSLSSAVSAAPPSMEGDHSLLDFESSVEIGVNASSSNNGATLSSPKKASFVLGAGTGALTSSVDTNGLSGLGLGASSSSSSASASATSAAVVASGRLSDPNTDRSFFEQSFPVRLRPLCRGYVVAWYPDKQYGFIVDAEDLNAQEDFILHTKALSNLITAAATSGGTSTASDPLTTLFKVYRVGSKSIRFTNFSKLPERFHTLHVFRQVEFDKGVHPDAPAGSTDYTIAKNVCDVGGYTLPPGPERDLRILEEIVVEAADATAGGEGKEGERGDADDAAASSTSDGAQQNLAAKKKKLASINSSTSGARQAPTFSGESETTPNATFRSDFFSNAPVPGTSGVGGLGGGIGGAEDEAAVRLVRRSERNHGGRGGPLDVFGSQQGGNSDTNKSRFFSTEIQGMFSAVSPGGGVKSVRTTVLSNNSALNSPFSSYVPDKADGDEGDDGGVDFSYSAANDSNGTSSSTTAAQSSSETSPYSAAVASNSVKNSRTMMASGVLRKEAARGGGAGGGGGKASSSSSSSSSDVFSISAAAKRGGRGRGRGGGRGRGAGVTRGPLPDSPATSRFQKKI